jgi:diaminopimelate epimerase
VTVKLDGGDLEVDVGEDLHVDLTGWAVPVYAAELSDEFVQSLRER